MFGQADVTPLLLEDYNISGKIVAGDQRIVLNAANAAFEYSGEHFTEIPLTDYSQVFRNSEYIYALGSTGNLDVYNLNYDLVNTHELNIGELPSVLWNEYLGMYYVSGTGPGDVFSYLILNSNVLENTTTPADGVQWVKETLIYNGPEGSFMETVLIIPKSNKLLTRNNSGGLSFPIEGSTSCYSILGNFLYMNHNGSYKKLNLATSELTTIFEGKTASTAISFDSLIVAKINVGGYHAYTIDFEGHVEGTNQWGFNSDFDFTAPGDIYGNSIDATRIPGTVDEYLLIVGSTETPDFESDDDHTIRIKLNPPKEEIVSTEGLDGDIEFIIFPNPAVNLINLATPSVVEVDKINIYNTAGQQVITATDVSTIDVSRLPKGVYIIHVSTEEGIAVEKFVKI